MLNPDSKFSICDDCINTDICIIYKTYSDIININSCKKKIEKRKKIAEPDIRIRNTNAYSRSFVTGSHAEPDVVKTTITCHAHDDNNNAPESIENRLSRAELRADAIAKLKAIANNSKKQEENKTCICEQCHEERKPDEMVICDKCGKKICFNCANEDIVSGKYFCDNCYHEV